MTTVSEEVPQGEPTLVRTHAPSRLPPPPLFRDARRGSSASGLLRRTGFDVSTARGASREPDRDFSSLPMLPPALPDCAPARPGKATTASVADSRTAFSRYRMTFSIMCRFPMSGPRGRSIGNSSRWCSNVCWFCRTRQSPHVRLHVFALTSERDAFCATANASVTMCDYPTGKSLPLISYLSVQPLRQKYSAFQKSQISSYLRRSRPTRGAYPDRQRRGAGCGGRGSVGRAGESQGGINSVSDQTARRRTALLAYGKIVWTRRPLLASSLAEVLQAPPGRAPASARRRRLNSALRRGEREISRKAIAQGRPECFR